jgi:hypothetical protein
MTKDITTLTKVGYLHGDLGERIKAIHPDAGSIT